MGNVNACCSVTVCLTVLIRPYRRKIISVPYLLLVKWFLLRILERTPREKITDYCHRYPGLCGHQQHPLMSIMAWRAYQISQRDKALFWCCSEIRVLFKLMEWVECMINCWTQQVPLHNQSQPHSLKTNHVIPQCQHNTVGPHFPLQ